MFAGENLCQKVYGDSALTTSGKQLNVPTGAWVTAAVRAVSTSAALPSSTAGSRGRVSTCPNQKNQCWTESKLQRICIAYRVIPHIRYVECISPWFKRRGNTLQKCHCHEKPRKAGDASTLKETRERWQLMPGDRLDWMLDRRKKDWTALGHHWDSWWNMHRLCVRWQGSIIVIPRAEHCSLTCFGK